jgi:hypothetical protein
MDGFVRIFISSHRADITPLFALGVSAIELLEEVQ